MSVSVVDHAGVTQTGNVRRSNEDSFLIDPPLFVVADGMGGAQAGEIASRMAAEAFHDLEPGAADGEGALRHVIQTANRRINERARLTRLVRLDSGYCAATRALRPAR